MEATSLPLGLSSRDDLPVLHADGQLWEWVYGDIRRSEK